MRSRYESVQRIACDRQVADINHQVLSVHPDYLLRNEVLEQMRQRWFGLTADGWHDVIAGLLRDRHYEIAQEKLKQMRQEGIKIQSWLHDTLTYLLLEAEEIEEALALVKQRLAEGDTTISGNLWYSLLDTASRCLHHAGTTYAWRSRVEPSYLIPPEGMCINVLTTAARHADASLATDVFRVLGNRATRFQQHHYDALMEAHAHAGDMHNTLAILCVMTAAGVPPTETSTRPLVQYLRAHPSRPALAFTHLSKLHSSGREIPIAAVNAILEASVLHTDLAATLLQYQSLRTLCPAGPNTATFNTLLRGCNHANRRDLAVFFAAEMRALHVRPDGITHDRLLLSCLPLDGEADRDAAFGYLHEMKRCGFRTRPGTSLALIRRCAQKKDERVWGLLDERRADTGEVETQRLRGWVEEVWEEMEMKRTADGRRWG